MSQTSGGPGKRPGGPGLVPPDPEIEARIKDLEAQITELAGQLAQCEAQAKELMAREAAGEGSQASEIHRLKQRKMVLLTEIQHRKVRINALLLGL